SQGDGALAAAYAQDVEIAGLRSGSARSVREKEEMKRPHFVRNWREVEPAEQIKPPMLDETFGYVGELAPDANISHLRIAHMRLPAGVRLYPPMALRNLEIFAFVLEGEPDLFVDGYLHRLGEGDGISLNSRTGIVHSIINNSNLVSHHPAATE